MGGEAKFEEPRCEHPGIVLQPRWLFLNPPAASRDSAYQRSSLETQSHGFYWEAGHVGTLCLAYIQTKFQISRRKQVFSIHHLSVPFRHRKPRSGIGNSPQIQVPGCQPGPTLVSRSLREWQAVSPAV